MTKVAGGMAGIAVSVALLIGVAFLFMFGVSACNNFNRSQAVKDTRNNVVRARLKANNTIVLTDIEVKRYNQQIRIERLKARVRFIHSVGIKRAQDEIAKTLTPLYVAFEQTQAEQALATSGRNNTIIYVPTSPSSGLPIVPGLQPGSNTTLGGK